MAPVGKSFVAVVLAIGFGAAIFLDRSTAQAAGEASPWASSSARFALASCVAVPVGLAIGLTPKIFWESFTGDWSLNCPPAL